MSFVENEIFLIALTFGVFLLSKLLQKKTGMMLLNPVLISIALIIIFVKATNINYETYEKSSQMISFWLKPAIVALGIPLYQQLESIKKQLLPILLSQLAGCFVGVVSVVFIARILGASKEVALSMAPKSVTTPIAIEISRSLGGIPSLSAIVVIFVGLFGAIVGFHVLRLFHIKTDISQGLSLGAAAHAVGTDRAMSQSKLHGAYASLGLILNGIFTAILTPAILSLFGWL